MHLRVCASLAISPTNFASVVVGASGQGDFDPAALVELSSPFASRVPLTLYASFPKLVFFFFADVGTVKLEHLLRC